MFRISTVFLNSHLIVRVSDYNEAYIEQAAPHSRPTAGHIGDVQANSSFTKSFIFDEKMITCNFYEEKLMCRLQHSYLQTMITDRVNALPMTIGNHHLRLGAQAELKSTAITSSPLVVHLSFQDYSLYLETYTACPKIVGDILPPKGYFACDKLATLSVRAYSTCLAGEVTVSFQGITISTRVLRLTDKETEHTIEFKNRKEVPSGEALLPRSHGRGMSSANLLPPGADALHSGSKLYNNEYIRKIFCRSLALE